MIQHICLRRGKKFFKEGERYEENFVLYHIVSQNLDCAICNEYAVVHIDCNNRKQPRRSSKINS